MTAKGARSTVFSLLQFHRRSSGDKDLYTVLKQTTVARSAELLQSDGGENKMSNSYAAVTVLIFAIVAIMHLVRIVSGWSVAVGPHNIPWAGLVVAALLAIWGVAQIG